MTSRPIDPEVTRPLTTEQDAGSPGESSAEDAVTPTRADADRDSLLALPKGYRLQEFVIESTIGEGGFGIVYLARDTRLDRVVAIKEFLPAAFASRTRAFVVSVRSEKHRNSFSAGRRSFINEAKLLAQFDHPGLVKVYRYWEENGTAYIAMPYYAGLTMKDWLHQRKDKVSEQRLLHVVAALCDPLEMLHANGVFHRDIAPDNIRIVEGDQPVLLDLGAARKIMADMTQNVTVFFKEGFAPIEQYAEVASLRQGPWTDVYALAAVLYYCVAGRAPPPAAARMVKDECVPAVVAGAGRYSPGFLAAIDRALAVRPERRTRSVQQFRADLGGVAPQSRPPQDEPPRVSPPPEAKAASKKGGTVLVPVSRAAWPRAGTVALGMGAVALTLILTFKMHGRSANPPAPLVPPATVRQDPAVTPSQDPAAQQVQQTISSAGTRISHVKDVLVGAPDVSPSLFATSDAALDDARVKLASGQTQAAAQIARAAADDAERSAREFLLERELAYRQTAEQSLKRGDIAGAEAAVAQAKTMRTRGAQL